MRDYVTDDIRNVAVVGHGGEGKTTLVEAMLFASGAIDRQGKVEDGSMVTDFDAEEQRRGISISAAVAPVEWNDKKLNFVDVPGYFDFVGELMGAMRVCDSALITVGSVSGVTVGAEKAWDQCGKHGVSKCFIINQMDREHANFQKTFDQLRDRFGAEVVPILLPLGEGLSFKGVVNVLTGKAFESNGKAVKEVPIPADMADAIAHAREEIMEAVAGTDEELMEKFFEEGELSDDEILKGLRIGMAEGLIVPVGCCAAVSGIGVLPLMDMLAAYMPSPSGRQVAGENPKNGDAETRACDPDAPFSALVFKTIVDKFVGKMSIFKVCSGTLTNSTSVVNANADKAEKTGNLFVLRGKEQIAVDKLIAGDIGAVAKLQYTNTGHTLCDAAKPVRFDAITFPNPSISMAVYAKKTGEEDKIFSGLARLQEEDPTIRVGKDPDTLETLLSGQGEMHIEVVSRKLSSKFGVEAQLQDPKIAYRETIRKTVKAQGRHKKQSGGHGQFGDVWIEFGPLPDATVDFEFVDKVVGGVVPRNFIPSVEKGLRENIVRGVLAGYPMFGIRATLYDGSYHAVDSSEMAFKTAARIAYKKGCAEASPVLLEPIYSVKVLVPDEYMGDIIGDMNRRRGRIMGMDQVEGMQQVAAEVPQAEMFKYATDLRSMTQARGSFSMAFERYEEVPANIAQKVIENAAKDEDEDE
ncbi:MAG: elongation factor G [Clostridia bacterium]|nr:elongation factor G [Clostridia bacterium]